MKTCRRNDVYLPQKKKKNLVYVRPTVFEIPGGIIFEDILGKMHFPNILGTLVVFGVPFWGTIVSKILFRTFFPLSSFSYLQ